MESSAEKKQEAMETDQDNSDCLDLTEFEQRVHASSERWTTVQQVYMIISVVTRASLRFLSHSITG